MNPTIAAAREYKTSKQVTADMADIIKRQETSLEGLDHLKMREIKAAVRAQKEAAYKQELEELQEVLDLKSRRLLEAAREKGASSWLSALPIKRLGYAVNKQEFRDAIALRYGWSIHGMPKHCGCGQLKSVDHAMTCGNGGYVIMRHNAIRDTDAKLMKEVCKLHFKVLVTKSGHFSEKIILLSCFVLGVQILLYRHGNCVGFQKIIGFYGI